MDLKPRPNRRLYIRVLRSMTPEARLRKAFELTELTRRLLRVGLKRRFPNKSASELHGLFLKRLAKCHNSRS
ncbi:MAG: hypothetical protein HYX69_12825 [Planctomycetia bacterium]|nr:hypothetical protein [Planctomycetia bacterium]